MSTSTRGPRHVAGLLAMPVALVILVVVWQAPSRTSARSLPPAFERYLAAVVEPSSADRRRLDNGDLVTKVLQSQDSEQVSVFGAIWINAPTRAYVQAIRNIETWEQGKSFHITRRISAPPQLEDFDRLRLSPALIEDLHACRLDSCDVKLDADTIEAFRTGVNWSSPERRATAEGLMRRFLHGYTTAYLTGGNERLAVFRDKATPISMADEFRTMVDNMPMLTSYMPDVRRYLLDFPSAPLPGASSFLYWQETEFGLKPTIRVSHMMIRERPEDVVMASKMIYANHYFRSALELRLLLPDPARGPGFWLISVVTSRTDGMTGFTGLFVRRRVRSEAREGTGNILATTKRRLENPSQR
jgi:hypothetical protein